MTAMKLTTELAYGRGTPPQMQHLLNRMCNPASLLDAYRSSREALGTGDLVIAINALDPSRFQIEPRSVVIERMQRLARPGAPRLISGLEQMSAHEAERLPAEEDAMWVIILRGEKEMPAACVVYAIRRAVGAVN